MKKKILSAVLALCLAFGSAAALPQSAVVESASITASAEESKPTSGKCGKNVNWTLKNGVLTISGKGKMTDYDYYNGVTNPFLERTDIKSVIIKSGVTGIGAWTFPNCQNLSSVTIPSSVKSIGDSAFSFCTNLTSVTIPSSVKSIGGYAFYGTKWLENKQKQNPFVIVNGILIDGTKCSGKVTIPSSVTSIGDYAFEDCTSLTSVTIPNSVTSIGYEAFYNCTSLTSVSIPNSVKSIGDYAFSCCASLKNVTIPSSVTSIGSGAFYGTKWLENKQKQNPFVIVNGILIDGTKCSGNVTIPNSVTSIGACAFDGCTSLKSVTIPNSVTSIGYEAFYNCTSLTSVTIPSSVTSIGNEAFGYHYGYNNGSEEKISGFTIYGYKGSAAEKYAKDNGFKFVARNTTEPKTVRYAGSDRAQTASLISSGMYKTADTVVLATGFDFHDALAAVPLASAYNAPLLLADRDNLSDSTIARLRLLKAKNVIVVASTNAKDQNGNDAAIRNNVYKQLNTLGVKVTKLVGKTYYETAKKVAAQLKTKTKKNPTSLFITTDKNYADALSASPVAAILGAPILYVDPKATLNATTKNYLVSIKKSVKNVYIVGGVNAVSAKVEKAILNALGKKSATRFAGDDRYATCIKINDYFKSTLTGDSVCIAKGYNFPDALAGGVFAAKQKAPLFLADKLDAKATISKTQANYLYIKNPSKLYIFGGETAVPTALVKTVAKACV